MKQFYEALKRFQPVEAGGTFKSRNLEQKEFFVAGMMAAADMVSSWRYSSSGEVKIVGMIEDEIRNACKDEG